eukprot:5649047-Alexandrium_andersonii.AAC.1
MFDDAASLLNVRRALLTTGTVKGRANTAKGEVPVQRGLMTPPATPWPPHRTGPHRDGGRRRARD